MPKEQRINIGGLMRCCIQTIAEQALSINEDGDKIKCPFCRQSVILEAGVWKWSKPEDETPLIVKKFLKDDPDG